MYITRSIESTVSYMSEKFPVILVTGPRQVGKTTMLKKVADANRNYVTLDDPIARELAANEPGLFLQRYEPPVIIDEIQYAPNLMTYIKLHADTHNKMGDIWLTGSQMFHLMSNVSESLAGRVGVLKMQGLSSSELDGYQETPYLTDPAQLIQKAGQRSAVSLKDIYSRIFKGHMPAVYDRNIEPEIFYSSYVNTYIQRDIKELAQVANELLFLKFLTAAAARTSQMLNLSGMARDVGISVPTAKQWLSILVTSGIAVLVEPFYSNRLKRTIKSPNLYFLDTGLCSYLTRWNNPESLETGNMSGAIFETHVVSQIIKTYQNNGKNAPISYYRDKDKREIDIIIEQNHKLYPIEVKKSASPGRGAIKNFSVLEDHDSSVDMGAVICMANDLSPIDNKNWIVPVWLI